MELRKSLPWSIYSTYTILAISIVMIFYCIACFVS